MAAAAGNPRKRLRDETSCPLCLDFFTEPVTLECGHNFCKACILQYQEKPLAPTGSCPQCRETIKRKTLRPNWQLANVVEIAKQLNDQEAASGGLCESHQEPLKLFCRDDEAPICVVCDRSKRHRGHRVVPAEEAAEEYKGRISTCLEKLRKERDEILASKENSEKESQGLLDMIKTESLKTVAMFRCLQQFLEEEEKLLITLMEEADKEIVKRKENHIARLSEELSSLENTIQEMEVKCEKPPSVLLEDIASMLQRCEQKKKFEKLVEFFPPGLKWKLQMFWNMNPFLESTVKEYKRKKGIKNIVLELIRRLNRLSACKAKQDQHLDGCLRETESR